LSQNETRLKMLHVAYCDKSHNATRLNLRQSQNDTRPKTLHVSKRVMHRFATRLKTLHAYSSKLEILKTLHACACSRLNSLHGQLFV